jgi:hypothetical protein
VFPVRYKLGFVSQKTAFFIVTAVKTTNLISLISTRSVISGDVSEERSASIIRVARIGELGMTLHYVFR